MSVIKPSLKKILFALAIILMIYSSVKAYDWYTGKNVRGVFPVIELKGSAYDRGYIHGRQLKTEIREVYLKWKDNIGSMTKDDPNIILAAFLKETNFELITRKYNPEILEELKGISDGSGQSYDDVFAFQLMDEFWVYLDKKFNASKHHCSSIGVPSRDSHPAYIAQNMDLENFMNGYQVLLHIEATDEEPEQYIVTCAGMIAFNGMNENGIALCLNTIMELQASPDGMPVAFIIRTLLKKQNGEDALSFLKSVKHASGQNFILGIADSVYDFEASTNQVVRFLPKNGMNQLVYHTNHALVNHDVKPWYKDYHKQVTRGVLQDQNSQARYVALQNQLIIQPSAISEKLIKDVLRSKDDKKNPVCRSFTQRSGFFTFSSVVFRLTGRRSIQITYGSPDHAEFKEYLFDK